MTASQRAMPHLPTAAAREQPQVVAEAGEQAGAAECGVAGRGQLDGQREPVEARAEVGDGGGVRGCVGVRRQRPVAEEPLGVRAERKRPDHDDPLPRQGEPFPARREHGGGRAGREEALGELGHGVDDVLAVVEHQKRAPAGEPADDRRLQGLLRPLGHAERGGDGLRNRVVAGGHEVDERGACRERRRGLLDHRRREPRLADPARPGQRDEALVVERGADGRLLRRPPDERRASHRKTAHPAGQGHLARARERSQLPPVRHAVLAQERRDVSLDRAHGQVQASGDLGVGQVRAERREHLGLAVGHLDRDRSHGNIMADREHPPGYHICGVRPAQPAAASSSAPSASRSASSPARPTSCTDTGSSAPPSSLPQPTGRLRAGWPVML